MFSRFCHLSSDTASDFLNSAKRQRQRQRARRASDFLNSAKRQRQRQRVRRVAVKIYCLQKSLGRTMQRPRMLHLLHWRVRQLQTTRLHIQGAMPCLQGARAGHCTGLWRGWREQSRPGWGWSALHCPIPWTVGLLCQCERRRASSWPTSKQNIKCYDQTQ